SFTCVFMVLSSLTHIRTPTCLSSSFFFFHDTATTEIYTLSLHDALPILSTSPRARAQTACWAAVRRALRWVAVSISCSRPSSPADRKSTRLNSSHVKISYAVFCLKKKKKQTKRQNR